MTSQCTDGSAAVITPHDNDILSGRGNFVNFHPGNEQFRAMVRKHKVAYVACPKSMKGTFAEMIVEEIKRLNPPGRFLKQDDTTKLWYDIGEKKALDKTRQALREGAPEIQKEISGDDIATPSIVNNLETDIDVIPSALQPVRRSSDFTTNQLLQERRVNDFATNQLQHQRRASDHGTQHSAYPPNFVLHNTEFVLGPTQTQRHPSLPVQNAAMVQMVHQDESDPYCSSLPPEHYENFETQVMSNINHGMNSYNPTDSKRNSVNSEYVMYNNDVNCFPSFGNPSMSSMPIEESNHLRHNGDTMYYSQNQQYNTPNSQSIGAPNQNEYSMPLPNITHVQNQSTSQNQQYNVPSSQFIATKNEYTMPQSNIATVQNQSCHQQYMVPSKAAIQCTNFPTQNEYTMPQLINSSDQHMSSINGIQPKTVSATGPRLLNQSIKAQNRTYNVRPQPIQIGRSDQNDAIGTYKSKSIKDSPEKCSSLSSRAVATAPKTKSCLRSITPRRMIINIQHPNSRSTTPLKMDMPAPRTDPLRYTSPPRNSRSRLRSRRDDSCRSMASTTSISFEKIFTEFAEECVGTPQKSKNTNSGASFLSVMSLSVGDGMLTVDENDSDSPGLSAEKVGKAQSVAPKSTKMRAPLQRNGSSDIMDIQKGVLEMSVDTISIDDIDVPSTQGNMSFLKAFE